MKNKIAISLIVLVITIIIMAILTATVVITLSNTNIIGVSSFEIEKYIPKDILDKLPTVNLHIDIDSENE